MLRFFTHCLIATTLIFGLIAALDAIPFNLGFLDPIELAFKDFELTDVVFSKLNGNRPLRPDTNIVIVNIGELGREDIARQIQRIQQYSPAVVGLDVLFWRADSSAATDSLVAVVRRWDNIVLASRLQYVVVDDDEDSVTDLRHAIAGHDVSNLSHGYINFSNDASGFRTIRNWQPKYIYNGDTVESFASEAINRYTNGKKLVLERLDNNPTEVQTINYQKRTLMRIDASEILDPAFDGSFLKGKIVLMGFIGRTLSPTIDYEDSFYTPLNERYAGRSLPDSYGVEIHANCISMVLHDDFVFKPNEVLIYGLSFFFCFLNIVVFAWIEDHLQHFYDLLCKAMQILEAVGLLVLAIYIFHKFRVKYDPTLMVAVVVVSSDVYSIYHSVIKAAQEKFPVIRHSKL